MKVTYDPTGKVRKAFPELTNEQLEPLIQPTLDTLKTSGDFGSFYVDGYLAEMDCVEVPGMCNADGEFYEADSNMAKLPVAKLEPENTDEVIYCYQHGLTSFVLIRAGEQYSLTYQAT